MDWWIVWLIYLFLSYLLFSYSLVFCLEVLFIWFVLIPFKGLLQLITSFEVLLFNCFHKFLRTNVLSILSNRGKHTYTIINILIFTPSIAYGSDVLELSLNLIPFLLVLLVLKEIHKRDEKIIQILTIS